MQALLRLAVLGAALAPSFVKAAAVSVHASVDWSQFAVVATDTGSGLPGVSFLSREDESTAAASAFTGSGGPLSDQRSDGASDWTSGTLAVAGLSQVGGSAQTGAELLANVGMGTPAYALQQVTVEARRGGSFVVSGTGMLTFRVPYALSFQLDTSDSGGGAALMAGLSVRGFGQGDETVDQTQAFALQENLSGPFTINRSQSGELIVSAPFTDGFRGTLNAGATSSAYLSAVPLPAPLGLLLSGLIGLAALRQRRPPLRLEPPEASTTSPSGGRVA